jgi:predicted PurR-regulated permease PerM
VVVSLTGYHVALGQLPQAVAIFVLGGVLIAWLPDVLIRPRLASETAHLPGGLYFVGFVGGLLTLGPVGVIAGPLVVALVLELAGLVSTELNDIPVEED